MSLKSWKMWGKWKKLFFSLLALNLFVVLVVLILINLPVKDDETLPEISQVEDGVEFQINTNKKDMNQLIAQYLEKEGLTGPIHYEVYLTDVVELHGTLPFFSHQVEFKLTFEPEAQSNGDLVLRQESISLGQMKLPVSYVMNFINKKYNTPDWVTIQPDKELIYVSLQNIDLKSDFKVKADKFDLKNDEISFLLTVPSLLQP